MHHNVRELRESGPRIEGGRVTQVTPKGDAELSQIVAAARRIDTITLSVKWGL